MSKAQDGTRKENPRGGAGLRPSTLYVQSRMVNWNLHKNILVLFSVHYHECEGSIQKNPLANSFTNKASKSELCALQICKLEYLKQTAQEGKKSTYNHTFMEIGIIIEHSSSKRNGITKKSYHGLSAGYMRYHSYTKGHKVN